jgi:hypothetical protein
MKNVREKESQRNRKIDISIECALIIDIESETSRTKKGSVAVIIATEA